LKIITFYADCDLPAKADKNQKGFDWRGAIRMLEKSAAKHGYQTLIVTDQDTEIDTPWLRWGDAKRDGVMMWLLKAQAKTIEQFAGEKAVMVSPDTLITKPLDFLFGPWDLSLLTRAKPKPIVNSVIGFRPTEQLANLWQNIVEEANALSDESKSWGADIDAVVNVLRINPSENSGRIVNGVVVRMMPVDGIFQSVPMASDGRRINAPILDFKGPRKAMMQSYATLIGCYEKT
jgi:hypothetical protein